MLGNGIPWYKQVWHALLQIPAVRDGSDLLPVTHTLGSAGLWLPARAVEPKVLHSFPVGVQKAQDQGLLEYHPPSVYAGGLWQLCAIASEGKRVCTQPILYKDGTKYHARKYFGFTCFTRAMHVWVVTVDDRSIQPDLHICTPPKLQPLPAPACGRSVGCLQLHHLRAHDRPQSPLLVQPCVIAVP